MLRFSRSFLAAALGVAGVAPLGVIGVARATDDSRIAAGSEAFPGPAWISIEYPPNPYDEASRGAFLLVNSFRHGAPMAYPVTGRAEGMVAGERRSAKLELARTSRPGVYALHRQWPDEGTWVLVLRVHQSEDNVATALVSLSRDGTIAAVEVPSRRQNGWTVPRVVADSEIEALLARRVAARE